MIGSVLGFFLELLYRKITQNKWIKPGVFKGIYLPLYGLGLVICYFVYNLDVNIVLKLILIGNLLTLIEFICGVVFIKCFKINLWDYRNNFLNYKGLICFKFSIYWLIIGLFFLTCIFPFITFSVFNVRCIIYLMYFFYMILISDVLYTLVVLFLNKYC